MYAAREGQLAVLNTLLRSGASVVATKDVSYETPMFWVTNRRNLKEIVCLSEKAKVEINANEVKDGELQYVKDPVVIGRLVTVGADPNTPDNNGRTPLHHGSNRCSAPWVNGVLAAGGNPNAQDNEGFTPLHAVVATEKWHDEEGTVIVNLLLSKGADSSITDEIGRTPLDIALQKSRRKAAFALLRI